jgi:hypothetical protein
MSADNQSYLDTSLVDFSDTDKWTVRDAVRGIQIFGAIGSGKTSGSGAYFARKYLGAKWGGLVLCAKPEEAEEWKKYILQSGRPETDIIHFHEGSEYQFNPLQYETDRKTKGGGLTFNLTELFMSVFKMGQRIAGSDSEEQERFWEYALKRLLNRVIDLVKLSGQDMSVSNMIKIVSSAPSDIETVLLMQKEKLETEEEKRFIAENYFFQCMKLARAGVTDKKEERDFYLLASYFYREFPILDSKVQSTIKEMFLGFAEPFVSGILNDHFSTDTNVTPEDSFAGKIIILDFSVKDYLISGIYAQCLFKYLWQQSVERRGIEADTRPVFLWIDESHYFVNEYDTIFQTTARSSLACTVLLTQNISNYYMQMGGRNVKAKVDSLLGNLGTLIFHTNSDTVTNEWASKLIGNDYKEMESKSVTNTFLSFRSTKNEGYGLQLQPQILPKEFTTLKSGGELNNYMVEGVVVVTGKKWDDGRNYRKTVFKQHFHSKQ